MLTIYLKWFKNFIFLQHFLKRVRNFGNLFSQSALRKPTWLRQFVDRSSQIIVCNHKVRLRLQRSFGNSNVRWHFQVSKEDKLLAPLNENCYTMLVQSRVKLTKSLQIILCVLPRCHLEICNMTTDNTKMIWRNLSRDLQVFYKIFLLKLLGIKT